jgi:hypothetical protein
MELKTSVGSATGGESVKRWLKISSQQQREKALMSELSANTKKKNTSLSVCPKNE